MDERLSGRRALRLLKAGGSMENERLNFSERYCARRGVPEGHYRERLLREALYPHARLARPFLKMGDSEYFRADEDFLEDLRVLRRKRDFDALADDYVVHPANRGMWRRIFNLRVSVRRARRVVYDVMQTADSVAPFIDKVDGE